MHKNPIKNAGNGIKNSRESMPPDPEAVPEIIGILVNRNEHGFGRSENFKKFSIRYWISHYQEKQCVHSL